MNFYYEKYGIVPHLGQAQTDPLAESRSPTPIFLPRPLRLRRQGYYEDFNLMLGPPLAVCGSCYCYQCFYISRGAVCLRREGVMRGLCPCVGCCYTFAVFHDTLKRRQGLIAVVKILQGKSNDSITNQILSILSFGLGSLRIRISQ